MTAKDFRQIALSLPETEERSHMSHPDFRVAGKIFATLGYPDKTRGMVKLSPEEQHYFSKDYPGVFIPVKGAWGRQGATSVHLKAARKDTLSKAIQAAWRNTAPKRLLKLKSPEPSLSNRLTLMPLYEYECKKCGHRFEKIQKFSDRMVKKCPDCGGQVEQMISAPAVQFKGSGWYVTDYAKKSSSPGSSGSGDSSSEDRKDDKSKSESSSKDASAKESSSKESSSKESSSKEKSSKERSSSESSSRKSEKRK